MRLLWVENAEEFQKAVDNYNANPNEYKRWISHIKKLKDSFDELKELDISEVFFSMYNKYSEYLDFLTPDKIVCLFNIILNGLMFFSFFSILSIMLSENIINKITFFFGPKIS
uniref:Uncharacterized protein n=1 Tax=Termitomyces sp. T132 TaxID=2136985 RepID=A0A2R4A3T8_9AGAR|nr:hypothetical protein C0989_000045 [Termitomyces sp. T132]